MGRPKKCRRVCALPTARAFGPQGPVCACERLCLPVDEFEIVRLCDLQGYTQEECARQMGVARTTVQAGYNAARQKLADALVNGKLLFIEGGEYELCARAGECCAAGCGKSGCTRRCGECENKRQQEVKG